MTGRGHAMRLAVGAAGLALTAAAVERDRVGPGEEAAFRRVNGLPDALFVPGWIVMQSGTLAAAPVTAAWAYAVGRRRLAARLLLNGSATWAVAKLVKRRFQRPRPRMLVSGTRCRGPEATGLGYVSGHAGVAVALAAAAMPELGTRGRVAAAAAAPLVGTCRIYVGAHLPLDVLGGMATGMLVDALVAMVLDAGGTCVDGDGVTRLRGGASRTSGPRRRPRKRR